MVAPYVPATNFTSFSASYPAAQQSGASMDAEFNAIAACAAATITALAQVRRADGQVANQTIGNDQLKTEVTLGFNTVTTWTTGTAYVPRDAVWVNSYTLYRCLVAHTAGVFATDLAAGDWVLVVDLSVSTTAAAASATAAAGSATSALASQTAAAASAVTAAAQAAALIGTSTTSITIGAGTFNPNLGASKQIALNGWLQLASAASSANYLIGQITAYNSTTGASTLLVPSNGTGGSGAHTDWSWSPSGSPGSAGTAGTNGTNGSSFSVTERTSNTILAAADVGKSFKITGASTFTQTFDTAANLGATWSILYENAGTGIVTVATDGTTWKMYPGEHRQFYSDGANVKSICLRTGMLTDTTSGTFVVPPGWVGLEYDIIGAGGGGGGGKQAAVSTGVAHTGGAGGGGASRRIRRMLLADTSLAAGGTIAYTIGAAGTAGAGGTSPTAGGNGGNTTFNGDTAYGGGGGDAGSTAQSIGGAGAGTAGAATGSSTGGAPSTGVANQVGIAGQGVFCNSTTAIAADWGGATGGGSSTGTGASPGGSALYGGAGGGQGGNIKSDDSVGAAGQAGGIQGTNTAGGGAAAGNPGSPGSYGATNLGQGGGGGTPTLTTVNAGTGGAGSPGCGGGGGGAQVGTGTAGNGGLGGPGKTVIRGF